MALWDILGKRAGLPVYELLGGRCRDAVDTYCHTSGKTIEDVEEAVAKKKEEGFRHIRIQCGVPGLSTYGAATPLTQPEQETPANNRPEVWEPRPYVKQTVKLFEQIRGKFDDDIELLHDIHERVPPILAIQLVKDVEQYKPFFMEDPFSPEDIGYFKQLRQQTSTPLAMGELFNSPHEYVGLVSERLIDFIRIHISQIGGLTPARKVAALCEFFGVRTAWHGPGDVSPVGHACNVHLDLATPNFGVQESRQFTQAEQDVFPGCPTLKNGYFNVTDEPGFGIDLDEAAAAKFPIEDDPPFDLRWGNLRRRDGASTKP
jgi:mannonate dehydratase